MAHPVLVPRYVNRFACIGGLCEDTCCSGWHINLDRATYLNYRTNADPELRPLFQKHVKRDPSSRSIDAYGFIEREPGGCQACPFLDGASLCRIQSKLGEEALSDTCATFPRVAIQFGESQHLTLRLSCPEAARLALLDPHAFDLEPCKTPLRPEGLRGLPQLPRLPFQVLDQFRIQAHRLLLTRGASLPARLVALGLLCHRLSALIQASQPELILELSGTPDERWLEEAGHIPLNPEETRLHAQVGLAEIFLVAMRVSSLTPLQRRVIEAAATGLNMKADASLDEIGLHQGMECGQARLSKALETVPWLLEHYLLNETSMGAFPWSKGTPQQCFTDLILRFTILRVMLAGRAASQEGALTPHELAETVQAFDRWMPNGKTVLNQFGEALVGTDWTRLDAVFTLV